MPRRVDPFRSRSRPIGVGLLLALLLSGCLDTAEDLPPSRQQAPEEARAFHLRLFHIGGPLLFSTWPNETGEVQRGEAAVALREPILVERAADMPALLAPLSPFWLETPVGSTVIVAPIMLAEATTSNVTLPRVTTLPSAGTMTSSEAERIFGNLTGPTRLLFAGGIPIDVEPADKGVRYRLAVQSPMRAPIERTVGLFLHATPTSEGLVRFEIALSGDTFETLGCRSLPGRSIDPGFYLIVGSNETHFEFKRYRERAEFLLENQVTRAEMTLIPSETEQVN